MRSWSVCVPPTSSCPVCPGLCLDLSERAKSRAYPFWGIQSIQIFLLMLLRFRSVPLMGGPQGPSVSRSPGVSPQKKAGRPMGPSTPRCSPQNFLFFVLSRLSRNKFSDWFFVQVSALGKFVCNFEPFKLRAFSRFFVWDPHWNCLAVFGTQRFLSSCSGTLSSFLSSLSERYRSGLAGTHTHTGGTPFPFCLASPVAAFFLFFFLCSFAPFRCHLVLVSDSRGSVKYPQILVF